MSFPIVSGGTSLTAFGFADDRLSSSWRIRVFMASYSDTDGPFAAPGWPASPGATAAGSPTDAALAPLSAVDAGDGYFGVDVMLGARLDGCLRGEATGESASYAQVACRARAQLLQGIPLSQRVFRLRHGMQALAIHQTYVLARAAEATLRAGLTRPACGGGVVEGSSQFASFGSSRRGDMGISELENTGCAFAWEIPSANSGRLHRSESGERTVTAWRETALSGLKKSGSALHELLRLAVLRGYDASYWLKMPIPRFISV